MRTSLQRYAPYGYFSKVAGEERYHLFLVVPLAAGDAIIFPSAPVYRGTATEIDITVNRSTGNQDAFEIAHYELTPAATFGQAFDPLTFTIELAVSVIEGGETVESHAMTLVYVDADDGEVSETEIQQKLADNCPYVFLTREAAGENGVPAPHLPHLLLAPQGYEFKAGEEVDVVTNPETGICEAWIVLSKTTNGAVSGQFAPFVVPSDLEINAGKYYDSGQIAGFFEATTVLFEDDLTAQEFLNKNLLDQHEVLLQIDAHKSNGTTTEGDSATSVGKKKKAKTRNMH